ncbi:DsbA family protein [Salinimicrobium sp. CDJ15-81-2]|nr:DsbA family protein [Salinimicrobium nanhaiense]
MEKFRVDYFTDPLCCWSWALEPQLRKLRFLLKDRLRLNYVMGGLLSEWKNFNDQMNDVARPAQLGPLWMQARNMSGQPIKENIWISNPVDTSYLACMAVKAAALQSGVAEEAMLRKLREAVMMHQRNIGELEVILEVAEDLDQKQILKKDVFREDLFSDKVSKSFKEDLNKTKAGGITRFPTLLITYKERTYQITGYRPFSELKKTFLLMEPNLELDLEIDKEEYLNSWESLTDRELEEVITPAQEECF